MDSKDVGTACVIAAVVIGLWLVVLVNGVTGIINVSNGSREFMDVMWVVLLVGSILGGIVRTGK